MKKALSLILALVLCLSLWACGKTAEVKEVEALIASIEESSTDEDVINAIRAYDALSKNEQESVENASSLSKARKDLMLSKLDTLNIVYTLTNLKCDWISSTVCDVIYNVGASKFAMYWSGVMDMGHNVPTTDVGVSASEYALYGTINEMDSQQIWDDCTSITQAYDSLLESNGLPDSVAEFVELFGEEYPDQTELVKLWSQETELYIQLTTSPSGSFSSYQSHLEQCRANLTRYQSSAKLYLPQD